MRWWRWSRSVSLASTKSRPSPVGNFWVKPFDQLVEQLAVAPDVARLEERGADGLVAVGVAQALVDRARGVADLQPHVPQQVEHELDDLLAARRLLVGTQEEQIDVGKRRQLAAAEAAGRHDAQPLGGAGIGGGIDAPVGEVEDHPDQLVHQERGRDQHHVGPLLRSGPGSSKRRRISARPAASASRSSASTGGRGGSPPAAGPRPAWPRPPRARGDGRWRGGRRSGRRAWPLGREILQGMGWLKYRDLGAALPQFPHPLRRAGAFRREGITRLPRSGRTAAKPWRLKLWSPVWGYPESLRRSRAVWQGISANFRQFPPDFRQTPRGRPVALQLLDIVA